MRTFYLLVAYDGTEFHGWQNQQELRTVQSVLEQALRRVVRHQVSLHASGRTDAGVHAAGQVASFRSVCPLIPERFRHAVGARLPKDVSLRALYPVHPDFDARHGALSKLYRYRIYNSRSRPVEHLLQRYVYHVWHPLSTDRMRQGASRFLGTMDFRAMAAKGGERKSTIRTVFRCDVERHFDEIWIDVEGNGFLYNQVRNMVGTLINVGLGKWEPDRVTTILEGLDRAQAGPTAPGRGLCLQWVRYPHRLLCPIETAGARTESETIAPVENAVEIVQDTAGEG